MTEPDDDTLETMHQYGGAFARGLATLYRLADPVNRAKLRHTFGDTFDEYRALTTARQKGRPHG